MLDFIFAFLIICEIIFTVFCVKKFKQAQNFVELNHIKMLECAKNILEFNDQIRKTLKKTNKIIRVLTDKRLHQTRRIIMLTLDIIQLVILIKSLDLSKGLKSINYSNLKKIALTKITQQIIKRFLDFAQNLCAI